MVMSCNIVSDITCVIYFLYKILIASNVELIVTLGYAVCIIKRSITCFV